MRRGPRSLTRWKDPGLPGYGYGCAGGEVKVACADVGVPDAGEAAARARATTVPPARRWGAWSTVGVWQLRPFVTGGRMAYRPTLG